jgi:hypothetical protein
MDERAEKVGLLTHITASRTFKSNIHMRTWLFSDPGAEKKPSPSCLVRTQIVKYSIDATNKYMLGSTLNLNPSSHYAEEI